MRALILTTALFVAASFLAWRFYMDQVSELHGLKELPLSLTDANSVASDTFADEVLIADLDLYDDPDYGFSVAIPAGWRRIVSSNEADIDPHDLQAWLEPGYAVGFESPRSGATDRFADYILIEVLPGDDTGLFMSTDEQRRYLSTSDGQIAYDMLSIDGKTDTASDVDLVIFQRGVQAMGYTLGFYAIGEPANERALFNAFQIMLRTFNQTAEPFVII